MLSFYYLFMYLLSKNLPISLLDLPYFHLQGRGIRMKSKDRIIFGSASPLKIKNQPNSFTSLLSPNLCITTSYFITQKKKPHIPSHGEKINIPILLATNSVSPHQNTDHTIWFSFPGFGWSLVIKRKTI